jgi:hypothetical protein
VGHPVILYYVASRRVKTGESAGPLESSPVTGVVPDRHRAGLPGWSGVVAPARPMRFRKRITHRPPGDSERKGKVKREKGKGVGEGRFEEGRGRPLSII